MYIQEKTLCVCVCVCVCACTCMIWYYQWFQVSTEGLGTYTLWKERLLYCCQRTGGNTVKVHCYFYHMYEDSFRSSQLDNNGNESVLGNVGQQAFFCKWLDINSLGFMS